MAVVGVAVVVAVAGVGLGVAYLSRLRRDLAASQSALETAHRELLEVHNEIDWRSAVQVEQLDRLDGLRRFFSPRVVDALVASESEKAFLRPHRREIAVVFCDLRGFDAFAAETRPEDVHHVLREYFEVVGRAIHKFDATIGAFTGDGLMAFLNDPLPCPDPAMRALSMATEMQEALGGVFDRWRPKGYDVSLGVGIALGHADIGMIGFDGRRDYTARGTVVTLAARLCDEARPGEILIDERAHAAVQHAIRVEDSALVTLKGLREPMLAISARLLPEDPHRVPR